MIRAMDEWAKVHNELDVFAQIATGTYIPKHMKFTTFIAPSEFKRLVQDTRLVVAHAGMGCIISALESGKPIVVMPRRAHLRETRNDHQVAAAEHFSRLGHVIVARDENELSEKIDHALTLGSAPPISKQASPQLINTIRAFVQNECG
jgi:UDP-N-acetylglucosamine transferase subunit ALG13